MTHSLIQNLFLESAADYADSNYRRTWLHDSCIVSGKNFAAACTVLQQELDRLGGIDAW